MPSTSGSAPTIVDACTHFNVNASTIYYKISDLPNKRELFNLKISRREQEFKLFLEQKLHLQEGRDFVIADRTVIAPKELDFYFPKQKFAVEISPTYTHQVNGSQTHYGYQKDRSYHRNKQIACEDAGVELITVFDWMNWTKTLSMIEHKLMQSPKKINARDCRVVLLDRNDSRGAVSRAKEFLDQSHVLGFSGRGADCYVLLEHAGEIVGAAAFGKPRFSSAARDRANGAAEANDVAIERSSGAAVELQGSTAEEIAVNSGGSDSGETVELQRLAFADGVVVRGGASRLLANFLRQRPQVGEVITFSDCDLGSGSIYQQLGFELLERGGAQQNFVHPTLLRGDGSMWRVRGSSLVWQGADRLLKNFPGYSSVGLECRCVGEHHADASCLPSNQQILSDYGFVKVFDCGYKKWRLQVAKVGG